MALQARHLGPFRIRRNLERRVVRSDWRKGWMRIFLPEQCLLRRQMTASKSRKASTSSRVSSSNRCIPTSLMTTVRMLWASFILWASLTLTLHPSTLQVEACAPGVDSRAKAVLGGMRDLDLNYSIFGDCLLKKKNALDLVLPSNEFTAGSFPRQSAQAIDEYSKICPVSTEVCASMVDGIEGNSGPGGVVSYDTETMTEYKIPKDGGNLCVREEQPEANGVTVLEFSLSISQGVWQNMKELQNTANGEWAYRVAQVFGIPPNEVTIAFLFTPQPVEPQAKEFRILRAGMQVGGGPGRRLKTDPILAQTLLQIKNSNLADPAIRPHLDEESGDEYVATKNQPVRRKRREEETAKRRKRRLFRGNSKSNADAGISDVDEKIDKLRFVSSNGITSGEINDISGNNENLPEAGGQIKSKSKSGMLRRARVQDEDRPRKTLVVKSMVQEEFMGEAPLRSKRRDLVDMYPNPADKRNLDTSEERRMVVAIRIETRRGLSETCPVSVWRLDKIIGLPSNADYLSKPQIKTYENIRTLAYLRQVYKMYLTFESKVSELVPLHSEWTLCMDKNIPKVEGEKSRLKRKTYLFCGEVLSEAMLPDEVPEAKAEDQDLHIECKHQYPQTGSSTPGSQKAGVYTDVMEVQISHSAHVIDYTMVLGITGHIRKMLAKHIFGDDSESTMYRVKTLRNVWGGVKKYVENPDYNKAEAGVAGANIDGDGNPIPAMKDKNFFEAGFILQFILYAPGWKTYGEKNSQKVIQNYCCNPEKGMKLRDEFYTYLEEGVAAGNYDDLEGGVNFEDFIPYMDKAHYIDWRISPVTFKKQVFFDDLPGVCDGTDSSCTTDAPFQGDGATGGTTSSGGSGTTDGDGTIQEQACRAQSTYCGCANAGCKWSFNVGCILDQGVEISCEQCPTMPSCPNAVCAGESSACECAVKAINGVDKSSSSNANTAKCGWDHTQFACTNTLVETGVLCDHCGTQDKCISPIIVSQTPSEGQETKLLMIDYTYQFSEKVMLNPDIEKIVKDAKEAAKVSGAVIKNWANLICADTVVGVQDITFYHRIDAERLHFDRVILPLDSSPNDKTRICTLMILSGALTDLYGNTFKGNPGHDIRLLDSVTPFLLSFTPAHEKSLTITDSELQEYFSILLTFDENVLIDPTVLDLVYIRKLEDINEPRNRIYIIADDVKIIGRANNQDTDDVISETVTDDKTVCRISLKRLDGSLSRNQKYALHFPKGLLKDQAGYNEFIGVPCNGGSSNPLDQHPDEVCRGSPNYYYTFFLPSLSAVGGMMNDAIGGMNDAGQNIEKGSDDSTIYFIAGFSAMALVLMLFFSCMYNHCVLWKKRLAYQSNPKGDNIHKAISRKNSTNNSSLAGIGGSNNIFSSLRTVSNSVTTSSQKNRNPKNGPSGTTTSSGLDGGDQEDHLPAWRRVSSLRVAPEDEMMSDTSDGNNKNFMPTNYRASGREFRRAEEQWRKVGGGIRASVAMKGKRGSNSKENSKETGGNRPTTTDSAGNLPYPRRDSTTEQVLLTEAERVRQAREAFDRKRNSQSSKLGREDINENDPRVSQKVSRSSKAGPDLVDGRRASGIPIYGSGFTKDSKETPSTTATGSNKDSSGGSSAAQASAAYQEYRRETEQERAIRKEKERKDKERKEFEKKQRDERKARQSARQQQDTKENQQEKDKKREPHFVHSKDNVEAAAMTKEIEKMLRDNFNSNEAEKKKIFKNLQLKYHPDKNDDPLAKTVFQFVQGAKPWFMQE